MDDESRYSPQAPGRRRLRRPLVGLLVLLLVLAGPGWASAYAWTRTQFYVGAAGEQVAIYQGLADSLPGIPLSRVYRVQPLALAALPPYYQDRVRGNIEVPSLESARATVAELTAAAERCATPPPTTPDAHSHPARRHPAGRDDTDAGCDDHTARRPPPSTPTPTPTPSPSGGPVAPEC